MQKDLDKNILAVYDLRDKAGRDNLAGLLESLCDKGSWHLYVRQPGKEFTHLDVFGRRNVKFDGFIVTMPGTPRAMKSLATAKVPTVLVNITDKDLAARSEAVSSVWMDNADIGRQGAEHLLSRGDYRSAGYVHELSYTFYSYEREIAFRQTLRQHGMKSTSFPSDGHYENFQRRLRQWLRALPKPTAIMAVSDRRAADVINACRDEGLSVPDQVAVIGVDHDTSQHRKCNMTITSILQDSREMGRQAAEELDFLFRHPTRNARPHEVLIPVKEIIPDESTARSNRGAELVRQALDFITTNTSHAISRRDVARHLGCSLQLAELRFRQFHGMTIRATIEHARMIEVDKRLNSGPITVRQLAQEMQFTSANYLSRQYKRHFGKPCRTARKHPALSNRRKALVADKASGS